MTNSRKRRQAVLAVAVSGMTLVGLTAAAGAASASTPTAVRHYLAGSTPRWLSHAHSVGKTSSAEQVNFGVLLGLRDQAGAEAALQAISDPSSASYGQWLSN